MTLQECRDGIDSVDNELLAFLNRRMEYVQRVGDIKHQSGTSIYRPEREQAILDRLNKLNGGLLNSAAIEAIFLEIFAVARNLEQPERVAFLGPEGSFTHQAAESRFGAMSEYLSMRSIKAVFRAAESGHAKFAVVPVENSSDGIIGETLDLLGSSELKIVAELSMSIHHSFATNEIHIKDISKIYSKDIVFGQCQQFLHDNNFDKVELIPVESTAKAAKLATKEPNSAAICSHIAAKLYGVPTLFENIEDNRDNQTRFIILSDFKNEPAQNSKSSILVKMKHSNKPGTLVNFLRDFEDAKINLTKIESRPAKDLDAFNYWFYIDFDGNIDDERVQKIFGKHEHEIVWLGSYVKAQL